MGPVTIFDFGNIKVERMREKESEPAKRNEQKQESKNEKKKKKKKKIELATIPDTNGTALPCLSRLILIEDVLKAHRRFCFPKLKNKIGDSKSDSQSLI